MQVVSPAHNGPLHLHSGDDAGQDTSTDVNIAGEGTLLVNVGAGSSLWEWDKWFKQNEMAR